MDSHDQLPPRTVAVWMGLFEGGLVLLAIALGWLLDAPPAGLVRWTAPGVGAGVVAALPPLAIVLLAVRFSFRPLAELVRIVDELLTPLFRECRVWEMVAISLLAGFGEEMLFRGLLQFKLAQWIGEPYGVWIALAVASLVFGLLHLLTPTYGVVATLIGLYLGWLWLATDNLLVPILAHTFYDALMLIYLVKVRGRKTAAPTA